MNDEELARIVYEHVEPLADGYAPWEELLPREKQRHIAAARAVRDAILPPRSVVIDRETATTVAEAIDNAWRFLDGCEWATDRTDAEAADVKHALYLATKSLETALNKEKPHA